MTTIYQLVHSPFCIPIVAIFKALNVPLKEIEIVNSDRSEIIKLTGGAYYQVPLLVDGKKVVHESTPESQDVARYVDRKYAGGRLFPKQLEGLQSIIIRYLENEVEDVTFKLVDPHYVAAIPDLVERVSVIRFKERKFGRGCEDRWKSEAPQLRAQAEKVLAPLDQALQHSKFLFGAEPVFADYLLLGIVGNFTYRKYNSIPARLKALQAWEKRIRAFRFA